MVDTSNSTSYFGHWVISCIALYGLQLQQIFAYILKFHNEAWDPDVEVIECQGEDLCSSLWSYRVRKKCRIRVYLSSIQHKNLTLYRSLWLIPLKRLRLDYPASLTQVGHLVHIKNDVWPNKED